MVPLHFIGPILLRAHTNCVCKFLETERTRGRQKDKFIGWVLLLGAHSAVSFYRNVNSLAKQYQHQNDYFDRMR